MAYRLQFLPAALRDLDRLPTPVRVRVLRRIETLADTPRPAGVVKLSGQGNLWRLRVGEYRVVYEIEDRAHVVTVLVVAHRKDVYRGL
jgi:mRNA interferase RelE/StbE